MKVSVSSGSRRHFLKTTLGVAGAAAFSPGAADAQTALSRQDADLRDRLERAARDPRGRILIRNATIVTMDPAVGDFARGDLLIEGGKIADVKPSIAAQAQVLDATGTIMIPGFADTHRHCANVNWTVGRRLTDRPVSVNELSFAVSAAAVDVHQRCCTTQQCGVIQRVTGPAFPRQHGLRRF